MKPLHERRLIELAFGDLPAESETQVAANPAAQERLAEYRQIKAALSQMREVPEHQLSTERMRQAILNRGATRRRRFAFERFGYVAAACGIFLISYSVAHHFRTSGPAGVAIQRSQDVPKLDSLFGTITPPDSWELPPAKSSNVIHRSVRSSSDHEGSASSRSLAMNNLAVYHRPVSRITESPSGRTTPKQPVHAADLADASLGADTHDSGVLLISDAPDTSTGLSNAKEVASRSAEVGG
jgi:hypothetical protein